MGIAGPEATPLNRHEAGLLAVLSVLVVAASVVGGASFFKTGDVTNLGSARCYTVLSVGNGTSFTGTTIAVPGRTGSEEEVRSALSGCEALWRQGFLVAGAAVQHPSRKVQESGTQPVPTLVACTLSDGTAAIFPTEGPFTCGRLGLATPRGRTATP